MELAAKAAGITCSWDGWADAPMVLTDDGNDTRTWNPLADDSDALRLAVKLQLWLHVEEYGASARRAGGAWLGCEAHLHGGIESATRRAIVRAAAAIGKEM
ncbi:hypothetical protein BIZ92_27165 [Achromobacter xylosoxidans]|uniref:Uncharacterized protein n=1 Tax=Alcaligenes xylosoxydans xylosoxydans TaxID=85698 RepID=A0A1R1JSU6_ALCXX|nr:hypothetical protein BIZ92_27165 [Achromobacter xylosoxidans]